MIFLYVIKATNHTPVTYLNSYPLALVCSKSNTTSATCRAGTAYPSIDLSQWGSCCSIFKFLNRGFFPLLFVFFLLISAIEFSVLLQFTTLFTSLQYLPPLSSLSFFNPRLCLPPFSIFMLFLFSSPIFPFIRN